MMEAHAAHYDNGGADYSVTEILDPPRIVQLNKRHYHKVKLHVQSQLASFLGTAVHEYAERMLEKYCDMKGKQVYKCEDRNNWVFADRVVSGSYDIHYIVDKDLYDIKTTKVVKILRGDKSDWIKQQNIYRLLEYKNSGLKFNGLNIIGVFWNWDKWEYFRRKREGYPPAQMVQYELPLWKYSDTEKWVTEKVELLKRYEDTPDDDLPLCTHSDMWSEPDKFAVKLAGKPRALTAQCGTEKDAWDWVQNHHYNNDTKISDYTVERRMAKRIRCEDWCPINKWCSQFARYNTLMAKKGS
jgi:hypothetical protein